MKLPAPMFLATCAKYCSQDERNAVNLKLKPHFLTLACSTYAVHRITKIIGYGGKSLPPIPLPTFEVPSNLPQRLRNAKTQSGKSESKSKAKMPYQSQLDRQTLTISMRFLRSKTPEQRAAVDLDTHYTQEYLAECVGTETRRAVIYQYGRSSLTHDEVPFDSARMPPFRARKRSTPKDTWKPSNSL
ncbi:alpha/beta hydrolase fold-1 [Tanacetum coccineum]|uniref:Alpha/beta hydrolase fold-1 n=1 Tax=Tanacetum coccineum TaxID=301880 RepID=A0ABQ4ZC95_9ASTR